MLALSRRQRTAAIFAAVSIGILAALIVSVRADDWLVAADDPIAHWLVAHRTSVLTRTADIATQFGGPSNVLLFAGIAAAVLWWRDRNPERALIVIATVVIAVTSNPLVKGWIQRSRPPVEMHATTANDYSFPSGHATATAALACALVAVLAGSARRAATAVGGLAIVTIALTRMYLGVHWLTDVVAGALVGCALTSVAVLACAPGRQTIPKYPITAAAPTM